MELDEEIGDKKSNHSKSYMFMESIHAHILTRRYYGVWSSQFFKILDHLSEDPLGYLWALKPSMARWLIAQRCILHR